MSKVRFINNEVNNDSRGTLTAVEAYKETGIMYKRFFLITNIKGGKRGGHAHKFTDQIIKVIKGSIKLDFKYFKEEGSFQINAESRPVFLPKLTWIEMNNISSDAIIFVLSSDEYNIDASLRDKIKFLKYIQTLK
tara:strand:+ start:1956 stop:2360 length:405 start_codon:yes stop_codon:yes gene_type:complete